ncbi:MAG: MucB/RseB C-terminal domain-containing protein [Oleiphilaceae bacterium]|nr:MucB/RseB C-terminal domain-containing protein [Oleiphilaceae bacterium]
MLRFVLSRYTMKPALSPMQILLALLFALSSVIARGDTSQIEVWLSRMQTAAIEQNYRGTIVISRGNMSSSLRVVHRFADGVETERLTQLDGAMGEIIRHGNNVMCVFPDNRVVQLEKNKFANPVVKAFADFMPDSRYYELALLKEQRLVNRATVNLRVAARDQHRYTYDLWLDKPTGLLLQSSLLDANGKELERFRFTQIEFPDVINDEELEPMHGGKIVAHEFIPPVPVDQRWPDNVMWQVNYVPPGFDAVSAALKPGDNVMAYSDGLASFSIFVERVAADMMPEGASMVGATVAYADKFESDGHHYAVTVVGQIPAMTAMMVAESVRPKMMEKQ